MKNKSKKRTSKTPTRVMEETFVMVIFSFLGGILLSGSFLWFVTREFAIGREVTQTKIETSLPTSQKATAAIKLSEALDRFCAEVRSGSDYSTNCPQELEELVPAYIENVEEVGGDWNAYVYKCEKDKYELNIKLDGTEKTYMENDNGNNSEYYELGTDLTLIE